MYSFISKTVTENKNQLQSNVQHPVQRVQKHHTHQKFLKIIFQYLYVRTFDNGPYLFVAYYTKLMNTGFALKIILLS